MFTIHRSERADSLVDALVRVVADPLGDPFTAEVVAVPTKGVERWLTHRIATAVGTSPGRGDGVCAHVEFPFPGRLVGDVMAEATGVDRRTDPWRVERLVWPLLEVIDDHLDESWLDVLADHLGARPGDEAETALRQRRRYATARHLAELYDTYATYRPSMVLDWLAGADGDLPPDAEWQAQLWRHLRDHVNVESPAERVETACSRVRAGTVDLDLPERISLFGLTRLPATYLEVLRAVATTRDVHTFVLHPSLTLWDRVADAAPPSLPLLRDQDPTTGTARHPLLRTWGNDTREMQLVLSAAVDAHDVHHPVAPAGATSLLDHLQGAIRSDAAPPGPPLGDRSDDRLVKDPDDRSIQVHACHGRARQVEVVRDAICHALADDPTLEPRDIVVLCPDIDEFAPLLHATFGTHDDVEHSANSRGLPALPYRLADRSLRQTNPMLASLDALLDLLDGRMTASAVVAFLGREPVRARFGFDDDDLERIAGWVDDAHIRWGLDSDHRGPYGLGDVDANTWLAGLDRVVLGVAMTADGDPLVGGRTPVDDVESGDVDLVGRLVEAIDRIRHIERAAVEAAPVDTWTHRLSDAVDAVLTTGAADTWQRIAVDQLLRDVVDEATRPDGPTGSDLTLAEVRSLLAHRLQGAPTRADFRTGAITMCTLVPMRAVPHRVVCVLGLDDGTFPRTGGVDGDDLLRRLPLVGDRDPRWEDRQLLLDALMSATETFIVTTTGRDPRTNEVCPPAVPLAELLDVCDRTARTASGQPATTQVRVEHPLQPFDPLEFDADRRLGRRPWAFDRIQLAGARATQGAVTDPPRLADVRLAPVAPPGGVLELSELTRFVQHPMREFLRQRLGLNTWDGDDQLPDELPLELDSLQEWAVGDRILSSLLAGTPADDAVAAEEARGALPPGALGARVLSKARDRALAVYDTALRNGAGAAGTSLGVDIRLDPATAEATGVTSLVGTVTGIANDSTASVAFSSTGARHKLDVWVRLVALTAQDPSTRWRGVHVGRWGGRGDVWTVGPLGDDARSGAETASARLSELVELWSIGMCSPLPLPAKTGAAWVGASRRGRSARGPAEEKWWTKSPRHDVPNEDLDAVHRRVFGRRLPFRDLLDIAATDAETGPGWRDDHSRFVRLAHRLWEPILEAEARP